MTLFRPDQILVLDSRVKSLGRIQPETMYQMIIQTLTDNRVRDCLRISLS